MTNCVGYVRVSTDGQVDGFGIDVQIERIEAYATAMGLHIDEIVRDEGYSGATLDRPGLRTLIERIENGEVTKVVIYRLDRISRSLRNLLNVYNDVFERYGCALVSVSEQFDTSSPTGRLFFNMIGSFSEYERETIKERMKGGRIARAKTGERGVGRIPYGYTTTTINDKLTTIEDVTTAGVVRKIFAWRKSGLSHVKIADRLNDQGVPAAKGGRWRGSSVQTILDNTIYRGIVSMRIGDGQTIKVTNNRLAITR